MADQAEEGDTLRAKLNLTLRFTRMYWKILFAIIWALFLLPFMLANNIPEVRCAYTVLLMAGYWIMECFPLAVTSLLPLVLFPVLGVLSTAETCSCYMNDTIMVFIGGLILAIAIEHCNLHLRIALGVMKTVGCTHAKLLGGLCVVTTFISMWVSNTAATAMMVPIIFAVLQELEQAGLCKIFDQMPIDPNQPDREPELKPTNVTKAYMMAAAYCSTFGGTGTLVGTGTNLTFKGIYESTFPLAEGINFTQWMIANIPQMAINSFLTWLYLRIVFMGYLRPNSKDAELATIGEEGEAITNRVIIARYKDLGNITFHETGVATLFVICIFLWLFRKPGFVRGWSEAITDIDIRDSTPVIFVSILMFFIPKDPSFIYSFSRDPEKRPKEISEGLITWNVIQSKMPWSLMFLLGGGFAISRGSIASCLAKRIGGALVPLRYLPSELILFFVSLFIGTITEFTSNVGIANITLPVIAQMCVAMEIHPLYLMLPATIMCSYSFRLPVGTPPNAIVSAVGRIPTKWLMIGGCGPATYALIVQCVCFLVWGSYIYNIGEFPAWASNIQQNNTDDKCK
ncbi:protein I'm not dead yet [Hylaeus volcanicus]|uniref:protein I'm not dead yet n=1 Tax=Hylaeus volcanicus TaxID=313075 RepID=UPI0023B817C4|nr:protein I'm not dead yet [Hylaeus volcanicus]XP_053981430.1 protein I'm not dead yet [Hylaeus volcanicus]